ncbi:hypothetical protein IGI49_003647 [Enterococcus sp. AZ071]
MSMNYGGTLLAVSDLAKAKDFYENVMEQKVVMDIFAHVTFEGGFSLQEDYAGLVGTDLVMKPQPNNFQLYFEVEDLQAWEEKLSAVEGIEFLHKSKEYPWGQKVMRIYDLDKYIVEVSESMESVVKRLLAEGVSPEETAKRTMFPLEFVQQFI